MFNFLHFVIVRILTFVFTILPFGLSLWLARRAGDLIYFVMRNRRKVALDNVERAYGQTLSPERKKQLVHKAFQSTAVSVLELFLARKVKGNLSKHFKVTGRESLARAFSKGKGVIIVVSHLGSWEYLSFIGPLTNTQWSVVVKEMKNPYINRIIDSLRRITTINPIPKANSTRAVMKELKMNRGVAILIDQWAGPEGLWVDFFNTPTSTTSIHVRFAKKTGCALVPAYCIRTAPAQYEVQIGEPIFANEATVDWENSLTRRLNEQLERKILQYPEQWLWGHRRWKEKPATLRTV